MFPVVANMREIVRESSTSPLLRVRTYEKLGTKKFSNQELLLKLSKFTRKTSAQKGYFHKDGDLRLLHDYLIIFIVFTKRIYTNYL